MTPTGVDKLMLQSPFALIHRSGLIPIVFYFPLRPQSVVIEYPSRGQLHQTLDNNFLDFFPGPRSVVARMQIRGTFGYKKRIGGVGMNGTGAFTMKTLTLIYETFNALSRSIHNKLAARQEFTIPGQAIYWRVHVETVSVRISNTDPLLYYYELSLIRLTDYLSPTGSGIGDLIGSFKVGPVGATALAGLF